MINPNRILLTALALLALAASAHAQALTNTLGMKFVPVPGTKILMAVTEVTVDQYKAAGLSYQAPPFPQAGNHPAVTISWNDAKKYCAWLSKKEGRKYRLPTDHEWSCAVGIGAMENSKASPASKAGKIPDAFPWGKGRPPAGAGNFAGQELNGLSEADAQRFFFRGKQIIPGYKDGAIFTAPVASHSPNTLGIYDLGGNATEWCEDAWSGARVVRGSYWGDGERERLLSSFRFAADADGGSFLRMGFHGFRLVLEP